MDCGILPDQFWGYSLSEIIDLIKSYQRIEKRRMKDTVIYNYQLANLIKLTVGSLLSDEINTPDIYELYPDMFNEEKIISDKERIEKELLLHKERMRDFAIRFNKNRSKVE